MMGGEVGVTSVLSKGSTFWLRLPFRVGSEQDLHNVPDKAMPNQDSFQARVLVVEDNAVNRKIAVRFLEKMGCEVDSAEHGLAALEILKKQESYDLILMDCQMPEMDGFEATAAIRELDSPCAETPIIALTANALRGDRDRCLEAGMNDYLSKPLDRTALRNVLLRWL